MVHYFIMTAIRYGAVILIQHEEVTMDDRGYNNLPRCYELRFDIEALVEKLEREYADERDIPERRTIINGHQHYAVNQDKFPRGQGIIVCAQETD